MRIDKYLKVSRIIKRRTLAGEICSSGRVKINEKVAKPSTTVSVGDRVDIKFGNGVTSIRVINIRENAKKEDASSMYEIIGQE